MGTDWASKAGRWGALLLLGVVVVSACGSSGKTATPLPPTTTVYLTTTTITGKTQAQVLGEVTPTLDNGIAFVTQLPPAAPYAQVLRAAQNLSIACTNSEHELNQATWTGSALAAKTALSATLSQTVTLVTNPAPATFSAALQAKIQTITGQLKLLAGQVPTS